MDDLIEAIREARTTTFAFGEKENYGAKIKRVSGFLAEKYGLDRRADGLIAILIHHPDEVKEWLDSIDLMDEESNLAYGDGVSQEEQKEKDTQSAVEWLMSLVGIFDSEEGDPKD